MPHNSNTQSLYEDHINLRIVEHSLCKVSSTQRKLFDDLLCFQLAMRPGYGPADDIHASQVWWTENIVLISSIGVAGVVVFVVVLIIVMSAARKTPSPVSPDTALPKRSKKVR